MRQNFRKSYASVSWSQKRLLCLQRDHYTCRLCGKPGRQVHHLTYAHCGDGNAYSSPLEDLECLCDECHAMVHAVEREKGRHKVLRDLPVAWLESRKKRVVPGDFYYSYLNTYKVSDERVIKRNFVYRKAEEYYTPREAPFFYCNVHPLTDEKFLLLLATNMLITLFKFRYDDITVDKTLPFNWRIIESDHARFERLWEEEYQVRYKDYLDETKRMAADPHIGVTEMNARYAELRDRQRKIQRLI